MKKNIFGKSETEYPYSIVLQPPRVQVKQIVEDGRQTQIIYIFQFLALAASESVLAILVGVTLAIFR